MSINSGVRLIAVAGLAAAVWLTRDPTDRGLSVPDETDRPKLMGLRIQILAKAVAARELLAGRLDLAEAAAVFAWVNRQRFELPAEESDGAGTEPALKAVLEWSISGAGDLLTDPTVSQRARRLEEQIAISPRRPRVNEADCRQLMDRAAAAVCADRGRLIDRVPTSDLRLVAEH